MATKKTDATDVFSFSAFDPAKMTDGYREFAEQGLSKSKETYTKMKSAADEAGKTMESTMENAQAGSVEFGLKAIDAMRTNADNSLSHMEALLGVKSVSEMIDLQSAFARKQMELGMEQARSLQDASRQFAENVSKPGKTVVDKAVKDFKTA